jgi:hypothetical protein
MKSKLLIAVIAMTISGLVFAQTKTSFGMPDCGEWVKSQTTGIQKQGDRAWLLGFLSGLNENYIYKDALDKVSSAAQIWLWMDNYCKNNPLERVNQGAYKLLGELMLKK